MLILLLLLWWDTHITWQTEAHTKKLKLLCLESTLLCCYWLRSISTTYLFLPADNCVTPYWWWHFFAPLRHCVCNNTFILFLKLWLLLLLPFSLLPSKKGTHNNQKPKVFPLETKREDEIVKQKQLRSQSLFLIQSTSWKMMF